MSATVASYVMNPAEDTIIFGDELANGMWVLPENESARGHGITEEARLRDQRFRRVTRLRRQPAIGATPPQTVFIGEWVDGYQKVHSFAITWAWIVKKDSLGTEAGEPS